MCKYVAIMKQSLSNRLKISHSLSIENSDLVDIPGAIMRVAYILNGVNDEGKKLPLGPVNMKAIRYLMILYLASLSSTSKFLARIQDNDLYFSMPNLLKISKNVSIPLKFDRTRSLDIYKIHATNELVNIRKYSDGTRVAITEAGRRNCTEILRDLIITNYPEEKNIYLQPTKLIKNVTNRELLSLEEFLNRTDVIPLFTRSPKFYGREKELQIIENFLKDHSKRILFVTGDGGIGKTRLVLESLKRMSTFAQNENWNIFFLPPYKTITDLPTTDNLLLVLDDAKRYTGNIHLVLDQVINNPQEFISKIIIIERNTFADEIESYIKQKNGDFQRLNLQKENLTFFLSENFLTLDKKTAEEIDSMCHGNYDYASFCAEYHNKGGKFDKELMSIISWKLERYVDDIARRSSINNSDVKFNLKILSLIMPFDWVYDSQFLKKLLHDYDSFMKILFDSKYKYENEFIFSEGSTFIIKPDPISDYFKLTALEDEKFENQILDLMKVFPSRLVYHMSLVRKSNYTQLKNYQIIGAKSWLMLNEMGATTFEYFDAIDTLSYVFTTFGDMTDTFVKMNPKQWIESFEQFFSESPPSTILDNLIRSLFQAYVHYAKNGYFEECSKILDHFDRLYVKYNDKKLEIIQGVCYEVMCDHIKENRPEKLNRYTLNIRQLYKKYPSELSTVLASVLVKGLLYYRSNGTLTDAQRIFRYTDELKKLYDRHTTEKMATIWCSGIVVSIDIYLKHKLYSKALDEYNVGRTLSQKYSNEKINDYLNYIRHKVKKLLQTDNDYRDVGLESIVDENVLRPAPAEYHIIDDTILKNISIVDFDTHRITHGGIFVFVLTNQVLPYMDLNTELEIKDYYDYRRMHVIINITILDDNNRELNLTLCPNRISNDLNLSMMLKYISESTTDSLTDLLVGEATIGIVNERGYDIIRNPNITAKEKDQLLSRNNCVPKVITKGFPTITKLLDELRKPNYEEQYEKDGYCPYCKKDYNNKVLDNAA
jgi:hypothetical protein